MRDEFSGDARSHGQRFHEAVHHFEEAVKELTPSAPSPWVRDRVAMYVALRLQGVPGGQATEAVDVMFGRADPSTPATAGVSFGEGRTPQATGGSDGTGIAADAAGAMDDAEGLPRAVGDLAGRADP